MDALIRLVDSRRIILNKDGIAGPGLELGGEEEYVLFSCD